jgi:hypothetical protein
MFKSLIVHSFTVRFLISYTIYTGKRLNVHLLENDMQISHYDDRSRLCTSSEGMQKRWTSVLCHPQTRGAWQSSHCCCTLERERIRLHCCCPLECIAETKGIDWHRWSHGPSTWRCHSYLLLAREVNNIDLVGEAPTRAAIVTSVTYLVIPHLI